MNGRDPPGGTYTIGTDRGGGGSVSVRLSG